MPFCPVVIVSRFPDLEANVEEEIAQCKVGVFNPVQGSLPSTPTPYNVIESLSPSLSAGVCRSYPSHGV